VKQEEQRFSVRLFAVAAITANVDIDATHIFNVALQWLKEDRVHRRELENQGRKKRGARRDEVRLIFISFD
jgi:hypothetical protein